MIFFVFLKCALKTDSVNQNAEQTRSKKKRVTMDYINEIRDLVDENKQDIPTEVVRKVMAEVMEAHKASEGHLRQPR